MTKTARIFYCVLCNKQCVICSCCDRGQIYCSKACSAYARRASCYVAGKRYQNSHRGRLNHAARQHRYRWHKNDEIKKVTHQGSLPGKLCDVLSSVTKSGTDYCHFCGKSVDKFLRRCFLSRTRLSKAVIWTRAP